MPLTREEFLTIIQYETSVSASRGDKDVYVFPQSGIIAGTEKPECISIASFPVKANNPAIDDALVTKLPPEAQAAVFRWIKSHIEPTNAINRKRCSYGLKHWIEADTGIYLTNNQFKHAMLIAGFYPVDERRLNWVYRISERRLKNPIDCRKGE